jgi:DNA-3-methyladenine glycosylase II
MSTIPLVKQFRAAEAHLTAACPRMAGLVTRVGRCTLSPEPDLFHVLVRAMVSQLISTAAAKTIQARLLAKLGGTLTPGRLAGLPEDDLRSCGLSGAKARALRELAEHFRANRSFARKLAAADDAAARAMLLPLRGVGPWTVDMVLMFSVPWRPDVLPVGDLGVRAGMRDLFGLPELPVARQMVELAEPWRPYRTVACWYLWRSRGFVPQSGADGTAVPAANRPAGG